MELGEQILLLREKGFTIKEIKETLNCSKSTISYYWSPGNKNKAAERQRVKRRKNPMIQKVERFKGRKAKAFYTKCRDFQRRDAGHLTNNVESNFTHKEATLLFKEKPFCYLSGLPLDINDQKGYELDHIIPASKGGLNTIENLGFTHPRINRMKYDSSVEQLLEPLPLT